MRGRPVASQWLFWTVAPIMVIGALALLFAKKAVHVAMSIVVVMVSLAVLYFSLDAPFLGVVQIVVYTGAVMMLFLFVLMLVGVDTSEDLSETLKGQRWIALISGLALLATLVSMSMRLVQGFPERGLSGNPEDIAPLLFGDYVLLVEVLAALLITAAVGALVLTHVPRLLPSRGQAERAKARLASGANPVNKVMPGVYARHNALDIPALGPDGEPIEESVSRVLEAREQTKDGLGWYSVGAAETAEEAAEDAAEDAADASDEGKDD